MKLCYQISTPDVPYSTQITAYQASLETSFAKLAACGYDGAELMVRNPENLDISYLDRLCAEYGLQIPMVCTGEIYGQDKLSLNDPEEVVRTLALARGKAAVDVAAHFCAQINVGRLRGFYRDGVSPQETYALTVAGMRALSEYAGEKDVIVALEPANSSALNFINTTQEGIAFVKEVDRPACKLMLDVNHMYLDDIDIEKSVRDAKDYVTYVHLADSNRRYPGNCKLDFIGFIEALKSIGYDGWLGVEIFQRPDQDTALEKSIRYLKPLIQAL